MLKSATLSCNLSHHQAVALGVLSVTRSTMLAWLELMIDPIMLKATWTPDLLALYTWRSSTSISDDLPDCQHTRSSKSTIFATGEEWIVACSIGTTNPDW